MRAYIIYYKINFCCLNTKDELIEKDNSYFSYESALQSFEKYKRHTHYGLTFRLVSMELCRVVSFFENKDNELLKLHSHSFCVSEKMILNIDETIERFEIIKKERF